MKLELLTCVALLAFVMALWNPFAEPMGAANLFQLDSAATLASKAHSEGHDQATTYPHSPFSAGTDLADANLLISQAAELIRHLDPMQAKLRYTISMFGEEFSGPGRYYQMGKGTRLTRLEFDFGFNESEVRLQQFCDGDFLYSLTRTGEEQTYLEFVDLRRLDNSTRSVRLATAQGASAASWLAMGSLTGLLSQCADHFEYAPARQQKSSTGQATLSLLGTWKHESLRRLLLEQVDPACFAGSQIDWSKIPEQVPHQVELVLRVTLNLRPSPAASFFGSSRRTTVISFQSRSSPWISTSFNWSRR